MKKDKIILILLLVMLLIVGSLMIYFSFKEDVKVVVTDATKIKEEYESLNNKVNEDNQRIYPSVNLSEDNLFVKSTEDEIIKVLENESGVIVFANYTDAYSRTIMPLIDEVSKNLDLDKIYYFDITSIRDTIDLNDLDEPIVKEQGSSGYYKLLDLLDEELPTYYITKNGKEIDTKEKRIEVPTIIGIKNGKIVGSHFKTIESQKSGYDELSSEDKDKLKKELEEIFKKTISNTCSSEEAC